MPADSSVAFTSLRTRRASSAAEAGTRRSAVRPILPARYNVLPTSTPALNGPAAVSVMVRGSMYLRVSCETRGLDAPETKRRRESATIIAWRTMLAPMIEDVFAGLIATRAGQHRRRARTRWTGQGGRPCAQSDGKAPPTAERGGRIE